MPNLNNNDAQTENNNALHAEVEERLKWWGEKHNKTLEQATEEFYTYLVAELGVASPHDEDDDFMIDAAETFVVERRVMSGTSQANASELVGYFIGVDPKMRDGVERKRAPAVSAAIADLDDAIQQGLVARAYTENGVWMLEKKDGAVATEEPADAKPWFLFEENGLSIAILQNNPDWSRYGEPITPYRWQRTYYFLGNEKDNFLDEQRILRLTVTSNNPDEWFIPQLFSECTVKVRAQSANVKPEWADTYNTFAFPGAITFGNNFVDEHLRAEIAPAKLIPQLDRSYIKDLSTLAEVFETRQEQVPGYNPVGPLVFIRGKVSDMRKEARDSEWDPVGHDYSMSVSSFDLMRSFNGGSRQNLPCYIHGLLGDEGHPFDYATDEGWKPYAVKSTVIVFGRLSVRATDDGPLPAIKTFGVFAVPRLAIPAGEGGNTSTTQYGE